MNADPCKNVSCRWYGSCSLRPRPELPITGGGADPELTKTVGRRPGASEAARFGLRLDLPLLIGELRIEGEISKRNLAAALGELEMEAPAMAGLLVYFNCPGGNSRHGALLEEHLLKVRRLMPVVGYIDTATSAAVLPAVVCHQLYAAPGGVTGGFGCYINACDGRQPRLVVNRQSPQKVCQKTPTEPPTYLFSEALPPAAVQEMLDDIFESDLRWVARYRDVDVETLRMLMDGRALTAREALAAGLIDGVLPHEGLAFEILFSLARIRAANTKPFERIDS